VRYDREVARVIVLFEDNHLLVVEKPCGVPSQADDSGDADMLTMAMAYVKEM
jgi:23S rRNA pseudouridine1911/1915/1917 synthase